MAKRRMAELRPGETLLVLATDREAPIDFAAWAARAGHSLEQREREGWTEFVMRKAVSEGA